MKSKILLCSILIGSFFSGLSAQVVTVSDSFDFGLGIPGRETVNVGTTIHNRSILEGTGTWRTSGTTVQPTFGGSQGVGNGYLSISQLSQNGRIHLDFDFTLGIVTASIDFSFAGFGGSGARGLFFGFDDANRDDGLMTNASTDTAWIRIRPDQVVLRRQVDGVQANDIDSSIFFTPSNGLFSGTATLVYNIFEDSITATVTGGSETYTHTWDMLGVTPNFGSIAINTVDGDDVRIHSFNVQAVPEPHTYALILGFIAAMVIVRTRVRSK